MRPGKRNLITDVAGLRVGNAEDEALRSGVTVLTADAPFVAAVHVMGGAPGTRETDLLAPDRMVDRVDALFLAGGSAFGLDAGTGIMAGLREMGRGFAVGPVVVPIVPGAILFDLLNGGDKSWRDSPYPGLGRGAGGGGAGFRTGNRRGGFWRDDRAVEGRARLGLRSAALGHHRGRAGGGERAWLCHRRRWPAFLGRPVRGRHRIRRPRPRALVAQNAPLPVKRLGEATTIAVVATDAVLSKAQAQRMAVAAHDGMARALVPSHTILDGDLVFALSVGARAMADPVVDGFQIGHLASVCLARAIARAVFLARPLPGDLQPSWSQRFGKG